MASDLTRPIDYDDIVAAEDVAIDLMNGSRFGSRDERFRAGLRAMQGALGLRARPLLWNGDQA